jgi:serine/threonine protein kinase
MTLGTGRSLGHYAIQGLLGAGGMGEVYAAEDTRLKRRVALKVLPDSVAHDETRRLRFEREAQSVAALNHPNIVTLHSVEQVDGTVFLTMELVEGRTLSESIGQRPMGLAQFFAIAIPVADAMATAHQRGITHRDLKPANIMVTAEGRPKILDFGLAKAFGDGGPARPDDAATQPATADGIIVGTTAYMSPEQAEGKAVDGRSDLFSLGVVLYEMLTGERPFKGDSTVSVLSSILKDTPRAITELNAGVPRELSQIVRDSGQRRAYRSTRAHSRRRSAFSLHSPVSSGIRACPRMAGGWCMRATPPGTWMSICKASARRRPST